ncbi:Uma2 family endonuclease [Glycomyces buryatensis]|nr:Uma2 family endonuclease [Glycomyces buryatensis]
MTDILLPRPPRDSGWESDDLDMYDLPDHVELIYGALQLMMSPQRTWHDEIMYRLRIILDRAAPSDLRVRQEMTVRINRKNRPEPDLLILVDQPEYNRSTKWFRPEDVKLVVEVESPESEERDRFLKPAIYAIGRIPNYLRISETDEGVPALHLYRLEGNEYQLVSEEYGRICLDEPFKVDAKLKGHW